MIGIGIDIVDSNRFRGKKFARGSAALKRMFTPRELAYCFSKRNPAPHLATAFAAKEALWKALAETKSFKTPLLSFLQEVEVVHDARGKPGIAFLSGRLKKHRALVSCADSDSHAIAVVSLET
jgi:holo-[acyl-carrier protein] synthase